MDKVLRELQAKRLGWLKALPKLDRKHSFQVLPRGVSNVQMFISYLIFKIPNSTKKVLRIKLRKNKRVEIHPISATVKSEIIKIINKSFPGSVFYDFQPTPSSICFIVKSLLNRSYNFILNNIIISNNLEFDSETHVSDISSREDGQTKIQLNISQHNRSLILDNDGLLFLMGKLNQIYDNIDIKLCSCLTFSCSTFPNCTPKCYNCSQTHDGNCTSKPHCAHCEGEHSSYSPNCEIVKKQINRATKKYAIEYDWIIPSTSQPDLPERQERTSEDQDDDNGNN